MHKLRSRCTKSLEFARYWIKFARICSKFDQTCSKFVHICSKIGQIFTIGTTIYIYIADKKPYLLRHSVPAGALLIEFLDRISRSFFSDRDPFSYRSLFTPPMDIGGSWLVYIYIYTYTYLCILHVFVETLLFVKHKRSSGTRGIRPPQGPSLVA